MLKFAGNTLSFVLTHCVHHDATLTPAVASCDLRQTVHWNPQELIILWAPMTKVSSSTTLHYHQFWKREVFSWLRTYHQRMRKFTQRAARIIDLSLISSSNHWFFSNVTSALKRKTIWGKLQREFLIKKRIVRIGDDVRFTSRTAIGVRNQGNLHVRVAQRFPFTF